MHPSTEPTPEQTPTDAECAYAVDILQELLHRIEVGNANAAAYPRPGRYTFLVSHAWTDGAAFRLVYTAPPSDRTFGLARDTRRSLINPSPWNDGDDPAMYYYLLDLEENWPGSHSRQPGEDPDLIRWSGYPLTDLPDRLSDLPQAYRYVSPPPDPSWVDHTPPPVIEPRRYANPL
ncbi:hypothetical protein MycrhDRAFT_6955 [Mycolicibacterium rhodesiae JS60]|nr:hypothetical protein MycrhDRAFT_6955 [Mycolicibacterium rhodesiae JS60]